MSEWSKYSSMKTAAQRRRSELSVQEKRKRRKILRRRTGKHLLTYQLLAKAKELRLVKLSLEATV